MPVDFELDSLESVDSDLHGAYDERDGKYVFNPDKYVDLKSTGLKKNNTDLKKEKDRLKADYEAFKKKFADLSDDDLKTFNEWREKQTPNDGDPDGKKPEDLHRKYQEQLKTERNKWQLEKTNELSAKDKEITELREKYRREKLTNRLTAWAAKAGVFDEEIETYVDFLIFRGHYGLTDDDEEVAYFANAGDEPSAIPPEKAMTEQLREKYGRFYRSQEKGGSGSQNGNAGRSGGVDWKKLSPAERMAFGRKTTKARA